MHLPFLLENSLRNLARTKLRTGLTMLGIIVGIAAFISMVSLGQGTIQRIEQDIAAMGINLLTITPGSKILAGVRGGTGVVTLVPEDAEAIRAECPAVDKVSPGVKTPVRLVFQNRNLPTSLQGASADFPAIRSWGLDHGIFFDLDQERRGERVCVLGTKLARELFDGMEPVGQVVRIGRVPFRILGVLAHKGESASGQDQDDVVIVPWSTGMRRVMGITHLTMMLVSARDPSRTDQAKEQITTVLRRRHHIRDEDESDFAVQTQKEVAEAQETTVRALLMLVTAVALVALLVGGVGVMNVTLASVLERTREIGIRMAVGARPRDLLWQFLGETVVLTSLAGVLGVGLGIGLALAVPHVLGWPSRVTAGPIVLSFVFSGAVGVLFGLYPAVRASRQDPIVALRST